MAAEYTFKQSDTEVDEPVLIENTITYQFTIENTGDEDGTELGFYLRQASNTGSFDYPATDTPAINLVDLLSYGEDGYGIVITQASNDTRFSIDTGDRYENRIPLTIGSGDNGDELEIGASVTISLTVTFAGDVPTKTLYVDLVLA